MTRILLIDDDIVNMRAKAGILCKDVSTPLTRGVNVRTFSQSIPSCRRENLLPSGMGFSSYENVLSINQFLPGNL